MLMCYSVSAVATEVPVWHTNVAAVPLGWPECVSLFVCVPGRVGGSEGRLGEAVVSKQQQQMKQRRCRSRSSGQNLGELLSSGRRHCGSSSPPPLPSLFHSSPPPSPRLSSLALPFFSSACSYRVWRSCFPPNFLSSSSSSSSSSILYSISPPPSHIYLSIPFIFLCISFIWMLLIPSAHFAPPLPSPRPLPTLLVFII